MLKNPLLKELVKGYLARKELFEKSRHGSYAMFGVGPEEILSLYLQINKTTLL